MPAIMFFGKSLVLACCGYLYSQGGYNTTNNTEGYNATSEKYTTTNDLNEKFDYPAWVAPPAKHPSWVSEKRRGGDVNIDINIVNSDVRQLKRDNDTKSDIVIANRPSIDINIPASNDFKQLSYRNDTDSEAMIVNRPSIAINIPVGNGDKRLSEHKETESEVVIVNRTFTGKNKIIQINIFNNGAPSSSPVIIHSTNSSELSRILKATRLNQSTEITLSPPSIQPSPLYTPPEKVEQNEVLPWWKTAIIYQIYPRSFKDSTNSGTGDLAGISQKIDYLTDLGVGAVWISPFYVSPMKDFGYDVADFKNIDPIFGLQQDFDSLLENLHSKDIKLIIDFIPNHSSDQHEWFKKSLQKQDPYTDYYVWANSKGMNASGFPIPPNNWISVFGGSAWEWVPERNQFYLHQFLKEQPDLNVRNPLLMEELDNILRFWLGKGIDGIRVDAIKFLFEVEDMDVDEPESENFNQVDSNEYSSLNQSYSINQMETVEAVRRWRKIVDEYKDRVLIVEVYDNDLDEVMKYYDTKTDVLSHFPFNFQFISELRNRSYVTPYKLQEIVDTWIEGMPSEDNWPNWVLGNHDRSRVASRLGEDLVDALNMFLLLLPGTPITYYGEEIGMKDNFVTFEEAKDPFGINFGKDRYDEFGRDPQRTPMQWDDTLNAGFSNANNTWLPVHSNYKYVNVKSQSNTRDSHLNVYKYLAQLRKNLTFQKGNYSFPLVSQNVLALKRSLDGEPSYLLLINTSDEEVSLEAEGISKELDVLAKIELRSSFVDRPQTSVGTEINVSQLSLLAGEGMLLKLM